MTVCPGCSASSQYSIILCIRFLRPLHYHRHRRLFATSAWVYRHAFISVMGHSVLPDINIIIDRIDQQKRAISKLHSLVGSPTTVVCVYPRKFFLVRSQHALLPIFRLTTCSDMLTKCRHTNAGLCGVPDLDAIILRTCQSTIVYLNWARPRLISGRSLLLHGIYLFWSPQTLQYST